jgi:sugar diacid utilization regulator
MDKAKPKVKLERDETDFNLLIKCREAALTSGWTPEEFQEFLGKILNHDYEHFCKTVEEYFDVVWT